jgi:tetratricopeptide (TPR) repeat protein
MEEISNPYIAGAPVTEKRMFFGREDVFNWIERSLSGQYNDHILVVHGQRRVGKTSVLKQLGNRLPDRYIPVFFDLQGRTHTTLDRFLWWLASGIVRVLKIERNITFPPPDKDLFAQDLDYFENRFLPDLMPYLSDKKVLLLTFDEFDNLEEGDVKNALARPLIDYLRRLMEHSNLNFIFSIGSSGRKLENMQAAYTDFFKTALYKKISFLTKDDGQRLITLPVRGILEYEKDAVQQIYEIVSGHPYFTQLICHELFSQCQKTGQRTISRGDVDAILDDVVERGTVNLKFVWDEAADLEKWALSGLAQLEGKQNNNRAIADFLNHQRVHFSQQQLDSALLHLREKDVLTEDNLYVNRLLQIWMKKNRPIEQAREELIKVNPIANHNIGLGLEYKNSKKHEKAIESFKAALEVDSDNLQAQVNLAQVYLDQKNVEKAIVEFEKALLIDDEDIATRTGLCDAYLAQGDQTLAKGRPRDAVLYYQKILAMNSEHDEARQRMAEINRQRAEKALVDNKEEEALSAFTMSLTFTPEDLSLIKRVEEVTAEKKAKVLAEQIARSEKEAVARNWEKAIAALNEALEAFPNDESILKKITLMKERRDVDLAKADQTEKYSRRDTPFVTNNENPKISMPAKKAASTNVFLQTKDGQAFPLERDICTIGRQGEQKKVTSDIDVTAFDSGKLASRRHAIVQSRNGTFYISDVDSTNGTYVNGEKIKPQEPRELKAGDVIELGKSGVRFTFLM